MGHADEYSKLWPGSSTGCWPTTPGPFTSCGAWSNARSDVAGQRSSSLCALNTSPKAHVYDNQPCFKHRHRCTHTNKRPYNRTGFWDKRSTRDEVIPCHAPALNSPALRRAEQHPGHTSVASTALISHVRDTSCTVCGDWLVILTLYTKMYWSFRGLLCSG